MSHSKFKTLFRRPLLPALAFALSAAAIDATPVPAIYYISQSSGDDAADGRSPRLQGQHGPWKTLARASQTTFGEGDQLLLKCGDTWTDGLELEGNGSASHPVVVSSYGTGPKPVIDRQDSSMASLKRCVYLNGNAFGWKIMNLELANAARGLEATVAQPGKSFLWLENLEIRGCKFGKRFDRDSGDQNHMQTGLRLDASGRLDKATVVSCAFRDNFVGAWVGGRCDIRGCLFEHAEWTGLWYVSADGGRISGNKFLHNCDQFVWCGVSASALYGIKNCVIEDNEFGETQVGGGAVDGEDLDFEAGCRGVVMRHNLFHDSAGPASMLYNSAGHENPNSGIAIYDNVFCNAARQPSTATYLGTFLLSDGNSGAITNNRIYFRQGAPIFTGSPCPGVVRTGNVEFKYEDAPSATNGIKENDPGTISTGGGESNRWVQLEFKRPRMLDEFVVEQAPASSIDNFVLQSWDGARWKDLFTSYSPMGPRKFMPVMPVKTSRVRILIRSTATGAPAIKKFQAFGEE